MFVYKYITFKKLEKRHKKRFSLREPFMKYQKYIIGISILRLRNRKKVLM